MTNNLAMAVQKAAELPDDEQDDLARLIMEQLAIRATEHNAIAAAGKGETVPPPATPDEGKVRVLVVDDEDLLRDFTRRCLELTGFKVFVASGGNEAIRMLEGPAGPVDLLFADCNMPGMSGPELIERVAQRWPKVKFVLTSGFLTDANHSRVEPYKVSILPKPYDMNDISRVILEKLAE